MLGHGTALISVATTEIFAGLQKLDRAQEEASLDLGANYWQTFWRVTVPNLRLSIIGAGLLIFTLSMDEIAVSFFLIGRDNTLPLEIWSRLRRGITPEINADFHGHFRVLAARHCAVVSAAARRRPKRSCAPVSGRRAAENRNVMTTNRRDFMKYVVAGSVAAGCPVDLSLLAAHRHPPPPSTGNTIEICHQVRDGKHFRGRRPPRATTS